MLSWVLHDFFFFSTKVSSQPCLIPDVSQPYAEELSCEMLSMSDSPGEQNCESQEQVSESEDTESQQVQGNLSFLLLFGL